MTAGKRFCIFIFTAFGFSWLMQALGMLLGGMWYQPCLAIAMFAPLLGVLLSHGGLKKARTGISWIPEISGKLRWYLTALWGPGVMSILCAVLFFLLFPGRFDPTLSYVTAQLPEGTELPMPPLILAVIQFLLAVTYAPFVNMLAAIGEEAGWRGYLTPYLTERMGRRRAQLLSGAIWGAWHWPVILLAGYEYGVGYWGAPFTGMLLMCAGCAAMSVLFSFLFEKTNCIWVPALAHGAINASAGIGILFLHDTETSFFLGPTPLGLLSGIPIYLLAAWTLLRKTE